MNNQDCYYYQFGGSKGAKCKTLTKLCCDDCSFFKTRLEGLEEKEKIENDIKLYAGLSSYRKSK